MIHLILGGARSGKSSYAEKLAADSGNSVHYIATATPDDGEMQERIARHQSQRPSHWKLTEEPLDLTEVIKQIDTSEQLLLVDCLTLWLSNSLFAVGQSGLTDRSEGLCRVLTEVSADVILVSNEVGMGIVPMGEINRQFVDHAGWLNQAVAHVADRVSFVAAGLPLVLKDTHSTS